MSMQYLGELRIMSFNFPPKYWAVCNGQQMSIQQNQALFSLLGTTYGGNGVTTFALPNLQTRTPLHQGTGGGQTVTIGEVLGEYSHTLINSEMPQHVHFLNANTSVAAGTNVATPTNAMILGNATGKATKGTPPPFLPYKATNTSLTPMAPLALAVQGGSQPHENRQPFLTMNVCIALSGIFPSRN
jgi:microcystin-dependent protein